jgi:transaldolase
LRDRARPGLAEVVAADHDEMMREAEIVRKIADNVAVKVPLTSTASRPAASSPPTARWSTSPSASRPTRPARGQGRRDLRLALRRPPRRCRLSGMELITDIRTIYDNYAFDTQILVASVRSPIHVHDAAKLGADVMTAPPSVIRQLFKHPLTDSGLKAFLADWEKTGQKIG